MKQPTDTNGVRPLRNSNWAMQRLGYQPGKQRAAFWQFAAANGLPMIRLGRRRVMFCEPAVESWISRRSIGRAA